MKVGKDMKATSKMLAAGVLLASSAAVSAAVVPVTLTSIETGSRNGSSALDLTGTTATFTYDDVSQVLTGSGFVQGKASVGPNPLFTHQIDDLVIDGAAGLASATDYTCVEGTFGGIVGASICGNYSFGGNYTNDSTLTYGPGTTVTRVLGGDDTSSGPPQSIAGYDSFVTTYNGSSLVFQTPDWTANPGGAGQQISFSVVPVPAAVWLFGSSLGLLGWVGRRKAA